MTPRTARLVRGSLLAVLVTVALAVAWTVRRAERRPTAVSTAASPPPREGTRIGGFVHRTFKGEKEAAVIRAQSYEGSEQEEQRLKGVEVTLGYVAQGKPGKSTITADEAIYTAVLQKSVFQGHVHVITDDGFEMRTEQLVHRGDHGTAKSDYPVAFARKDLSGTARGFSYAAETGRLELLQDVVMRLADPDNVPMDIRAARAEISKDEGLMKFLGGVEVVQGSDRLKAQRLVVNFAEPDHVVYRAQALDDVDLWTGQGTAVPGMTSATAGQGPRHLTCRRLDLWFRPDKSLQQAVAGPNADLTMLPGAGDPPQRRRLQSDVLTFLFDGKGRLEELQALKDTAFAAEPIPPAKGERQTVTCKRFTARMLPETGAVDTIEFLRDVVFVRGVQKARAQRARFDGPQAALTLTEDPSLVDEDQGTELKADTIVVKTESGDATAQDHVQEVLRGKSAGRGGLLGGGAGEPTQIRSSTFEYTAKTKKARFSQDALLRAGKDEVRAAEIRLQERPDGRRRLEAESRVVTRMQPKAEGQAAQPPVEARAGSMAYDEGAGTIVYQGNVIIRQGDIQTKSPHATLTLTEDGSGLKTLEAGEPVEVQQGARRAAGTRGTYTPDAGTMVLVGDKVTLTDASGRVEGRSLTFHVGDDRILVDGREEVRTQMILRQQPQTPRP